MPLPRLSLTSVLWDSPHKFNRVILAGHQGNAVSRGSCSKFNRSIEQMMNWSNYAGRKLEAKVARFVIEGEEGWGLGKGWEESLR